MIDLVFLVIMGIAIYWVWKYIVAYRVYIIGAIVIIAMYKFVGVKGMLIAAAIWAIYNFYERKQLNGKFQAWSKKMSGTHNYNSMVIRHNLELMAQSFSISQAEVPYGRATWFVSSFGDQDLNQMDMDFYGYSPVRSKIPEEFQEYGTLLATYGILQKDQIQTGVNNDKYKTQLTKLSFKGLWQVSYDADEEKFIFTYPNEVKEVVLQVTSPDNLLHVLENLISLGYTNDLYTGWVENESNTEIQQNLSTAKEDVSAQAVSGSSREKVGNQLDQRFNANKKISDIDDAQRAGVTAGMATQVRPHAHYNQINQMTQGTQGHGVAAEYANNTIDKIKNPFSKVEQVGQDNAFRGPDRRVGTQSIQTKYYNTAYGSVNAGFGKDGMYSYVNADGSPIQLEVPKDQYVDALTQMKRKIAEGKVNGVSNPDEAQNIIRKGNITYQTSLDVARGGNIKSISIDLLDGAVQSLAVGGISFAIVFAQAKWAGKDTVEASKLAGMASFKAIAVGAAVYGGSQQFAKIATRQIAKDAGKTVVAEELAERASFVISLAITVGPDALDILRGRISLKQFTKDAGVAVSGAAGGVAGGAAAGAILGSEVPGIGNLIGAVAGGAVASIVAKKTLDHFMEDDAVEMFAELKEEFLDSAFSTPIDQTEFQKLQDLVFDKKVGSKLKAMFAANDSRSYARNTILGDAVASIFSERPQVSEKEIVEAYETSQNEFSAVNA